MRHIEHVIQVAGIDHVGVSSDGFLDGAMARGVISDGIMDSAGRWKEVAKRLYARGHSEEDLNKMLGGNFLRVYRSVFPAT